MLGRKILRYARSAVAARQDTASELSQTSEPDLPTIRQDTNSNPPPTPLLCSLQSLVEAAKP